MNFDIAAEMADDEGVETRTIRIWDDVASAPLERMEDRRGIAGDLFVIKIAGGVSATTKDLDEVYRVTAKARDNTRSMGVAVAAGSIPETGEPTFELPDDEIEIGIRRTIGLWGCTVRPGFRERNCSPPTPWSIRRTIGLKDDGANPSRSALPARR